MFQNPGNNLKPLKISCTSSDCDNGLHCFRKSRKMAITDKGKCRTCGADLIDWDRIYQKDLDDVEFTFHELKYEMIRHHFWHVQLDCKAVEKAKKMGPVAVEEWAKRRIRKYIAPINYPYDGRQTPYEGNIIFYAQHATACCCRKCMEYWYGIPKDIELSEEEIDYFVNLIMLYVKERMQELNK
jgi:hypothetical protein